MDRMARFRNYIFIWLLLGVLIIVVDNYQLFGLEKTAQKINDGFKTRNKVLYIDDFTLGEQPTTTTVVNNKLDKGEKSWLTNYRSDGSWGIDHRLYQVEFDSFTGKPLSYKLVEETKGVIAMIPNTFVRGTKVAIGAFFTPKFSRYGVNCRGCTGERKGHGNFAVGISADINRGIRQYNGKFKKGVTFEGYYIVASDPSIPLCTVLEISNHNFKGDGLKPGTPFYAVVLDRGGAIKKNRLDFYIGDERFYNDLIKYSGRRKPLATIVAFGKRHKDGAGRRSCKLPDIESLKENADD